MVRKIKLYPDPVLRKVAKRVEELSDDIVQLAEDLVDTMFEYEGLGLSSNQIGELWRVIAINKGEFTGKKGEAQVLVNPRVSYYEGEDVDEEGCLSFPNLYFDVKRAYLVVVEAEELRDGKLVPVEITATGLYARALQHEIDHLNGTLFIDYLPPRERLRKLREWREKIKLSV